ncbi:MAG: 23S rRNA (adenine(2503)-C(2))-methyltransferase RlmN [Candidatus Omnitrophica bacterium]|nr:23S rRNA (adenine(2503)-C(2))-methyltransferase RlmN [Candidatus Omnitrophota bacterium]
MESITGFSLGDLEHILISWGEQAFRAGQIFSWIYKKKAVDFSTMSDLSAGLRAKLKDNFSLFVINPIKSVKSKDGTEKFLFALSDGDLIESVIIPTDDRVTACISTQVGCKYKCLFCASGISGFRRNLTSAEIIQQMLFLNNRKKITHIVFMGTGEPLDNYDAVLKSIRIINSKESLNIGARRITISTSGVAPAIRKLIGEDLQFELSVSLHSADDAVRSKLMPINKIYPLNVLITACNEYIRKTGRQITFEYVLIKNTNSDIHSCQKLVALIKDLRLVKVNLIPANIVKECRIEPPGKVEIQMFRNHLSKHKIPATLRKSRGEDIEAACGQLRLSHEKK